MAHLATKSDCQVNKTITDLQLDLQACTDQSTSPHQKNNLFRFDTPFFTTNSTNQSMLHSTNHSTNQPTNQSINPSINQSTKQATNQSINQPINQPTNQAINQSINQPISRSLLQVPRPFVSAHRCMLRYRDGRIVFRSFAFFPFRDGSGLYDMG